MIRSLFLPSVRYFGLFLALSLAVLSFSPHHSWGDPQRVVTQISAKGEPLRPQTDVRLLAQRDPRDPKDQKKVSPVDLPKDDPKWDPFATPLTPTEHPALTTQFVALTFMALMPFIMMLLTSFIKVVVVLSLLRSALGAQQAPPNQVINGVAFMLSLYIMFPTGVKMYDESQGAIARMNADPEVTMLSKESAQHVMEVAKYAREPLRDFLRKNSSVQHQKSFYRTIYRTIPQEYRDTVQPTDFLILVPSYITSQLKDAFEIGVLIYIPFFVIDLVTANILLAMGMMMLSPVTISMPLKLFLLVMLDGWTLLIQGLITTFQT